MPLVTDANEARKIFQEAAQARVCIPAFCTESRDTTEAIFKAAWDIGHQMEKPDIPVVVAFTAGPDGRQHLHAYTSITDTREGLLAFKDDIFRLTRPEGKYNELKIILHLNHAQPERDIRLLEELRGFAASVMLDCSGYLIEENLRRTVEFVSCEREHFMIEGIVDEVAGESLGIIPLSDPELVSEYVTQTGVDLVAVNMGTTYHAGDSTVYRGDLARSISDIIGPRLSLHGAYDLSRNELRSLHSDGIAKAGFWADIERVGAQALAESTVRDVVRILPLETTERLVDDGLLSGLLLDEMHSLDIDPLTVAYRRNKIWMPAVIDRIKDIFRLLGYARFSGAIQGINDKKESQHGNEL